MAKPVESSVMFRKLGIQGACYLVALMLACFFAQPAFAAEGDLVAGKMPLDTHTDNLVVQAVDIQGATVTLSPESYYYNGEPCRPEVASVELNGEIIPKDSYAWTYDDDCTTPGMHHVTVIASGDYTGTVVAEYEIKRHRTTAALRTKPDGPIIINTNLTMRDAVNGKDFYLEYSGDGTVVLTPEDPDVADFLYIPGEGGGIVRVTPKKLGQTFLVITSTDSTNYMDICIEPEFYVVTTTVEKPTFTPCALTYTGSEQTGITAGLGLDLNSIEYTVGGALTGTDAGTYTAVVSLKDGFKWKGVSGDQAFADMECEWTIAPASFSNVSVSRIDTSVYDGTSHEPEVTATFNGQSLVAGRDYTVSYKDNVNASDNGAKAILTPVADGNFAGDPLECSFSIAKSDAWSFTPYVTTEGAETIADQLIGAEIPTFALDYDGLEHGLGVKANVEGAEFAFTYASGQSTIVDAGEFLVSYTASDPNGNFNSASGQVKLVIRAIANTAAAVSGGAVNVSGDSKFAERFSQGNVVDVVVDELTESDDEDSVAHVNELKERYLDKGLDADAFRVFEIELVQHAANESIDGGEALHENFGTISITLPIGVAYAGRVAHVTELHKTRDANGEVTGVQEIVLGGDSLRVADDGTVTVPVTLLSEFVVTVESVGDDPASGSGEGNESNSSDDPVGGDDPNGGDNPAGNGESGDNDESSQPENTNDSKSAEGADSPSSSNNVNDDTQSEGNADGDAREGEKTSSDNADETGKSTTKPSEARSTSSTSMPKTADALNAIAPACIAIAAALVLAIASFRLRRRG